jgi:hypothetical protein
MKKVDAYKFFNNLVEKYPEDSLPMLIISFFLKEMAQNNLA